MKMLLMWLIGVPLSLTLLLWGSGIESAKILPTLSLQTISSATAGVPLKPDSR